jgi:hypothetical protein
LSSHLLQKYSKNVGSRATQICRLNRIYPHALRVQPSHQAEFSSLGTQVLDASRARIKRVGPTGTDHDNFLFRCQYTLGCIVELSSTPPFAILSDDASETAMICCGERILLVSV